MENNYTWKVSDIYSYVSECFILDDKVLENADIPLIKSRYEKKIRRLIPEQLKINKDYVLINKQYYMTEGYAKNFVYTNSEIRHFFLPRMYKNENELKAYFESKDDELNKKLQRNKRLKLTNL